ncbi:siroheme synthase [Sulfurospirillum diekertiae]|uniref:Siroheme synthase n=1 Tax=Sulfurospirillum diekertiae TaxID=1854492 RepID=A0A290HH67_9BACT|nr:uroporphyrinogen-III C-methyltransferase [Sulfurospirillum diekertiae]ATB70853.1 siroheme synthase [Sulfurospirillum diekertiae]
MSTLGIALTPKKTLLIGAGKVAAQKARVLDSLDFAYEIVATEVLDDYFASKTFTCKPFEDTDAEGFEVIIDATGNEVVTNRLVALKPQLHFWLNVVDVPELCDFYFSALTRRGDIHVSVSSGGSSPTLAQVIRDKIERILPRDFTSLIERLKNERKKPERDLENLRNIAKAGAGKVFLIGCGTGYVGNLTLDALNAFELLDVALVDALVSQEIRSLIPLTCKVVDVSKKKGFHSKSQDEINALLVEYATQGLVVGRLKGGDPLLFGRLGEEKQVLAQHGIAFEVINGITSALRSCTVSGIVPTIRDISKGVTIVSAHLRETLFNDDWVSILKQPLHTVIVLMAHSFAKKIEDAIAKQGIDPNLPAAFVSKIDLPDQITIVGTVGKLDKMSALCATPAVLIIGECVAKENIVPAENSGKIIYM